MGDPYRDEAIQVWVSDFLESAAFGAHTGLVREYAPEVLVAFLTRACKTRDVGPGDIDEGDLKPALLEGVAALEIPGRSGRPCPRSWRTSWPRWSVRDGSAEAGPSGTT